MMREDHYEGEIDDREDRVLSLSPAIMRPPSDNIHNSIYTSLSSGCSFRSIKGERESIVLSERDELQLMGVIGR